MFAFLTLLYFVLGPIVDVVLGAWTAFVVRGASFIDQIPAAVAMVVAGVAMVVAWVTR